VSNKSSPASSSLQVEHGLSVGRQLARGALIGLVMAGFITLSWLTTSAMLANGSYWSDEGIRYRAATLMFNYIDLGAVRRGLGGTLLRLTGLHPLFGLAVFHLLSSVFAAAVFCALIWQRSVRPLDRVLWVTGAAALFLLWSSDAGRTDAVVAALLGLATLQARRRPVMSALCLVFGLAFHEVALVYGIPLGLALWLDGRWRRSPGAASPSAGMEGHRSMGVLQRTWMTQRSLIFAGAVVIVAACVQALLDRLPHADVGRTAYWFWSRFPWSEAAEWALYFYVAGSRGIELAMCNNRAVDPNYVIHLLSGIASIGVAVLVFNGNWRRTALPPLVAALVPFLFLSAISIDMARWSAFAMLNAWFVCVSRPDASPHLESMQGTAWRGALLCALIFAASPRHVMPSGLDIFSPVPLVDRVIWHFTGPRPSPGISVGLRQCDPTWRDLLVPDKTKGTR